MRQHTLQAEIEVKFHLSGAPDDEREVAYPKIEVTYRYAPGSPAVMYQRNGDPGWPAEPAEIELINAQLLDGDGLDPIQEQVNLWAYEWLNGDGYDQAVEHAESMSHPDPDDERDRRRDDALMR
jgi:hypothetical protein